MSFLINIVLRTMRDATFQDYCYSQGPSSFLLASSLSRQKSWLRIREFSHHSVTFFSKKKVGLVKVAESDMPVSLSGKQMAPKI